MSASRNLYDGFRYVAVALCIVSTSVLSEEAWAYFDLYPFLDYRAALIATDDSGANGYLDQGTTVGVKGTSHTGGCCIGMRVRTEALVLTSDPINRAEGEDDLLEWGEVRVGVVGDYGAADAGRQWSPYANYLTQFTDNFWLSGANTLFDGQGCLDPIGRTSGCEDGASAATDLLLLDNALAYSTPTDTEDAGGWHGWHGQIAVSPEAAGFGVGFWSSGERFAQPQQWRGIALAGVRDFDSDAKSLGFTAGMRSAGGLDLGARLERFSTADATGGRAFAFSLALHDLSRRICVGEHRCWPLPTYWLVKSQLKAGYRDRQLHLGPSTHRTRDTLLGLEHEHTRALSFAIEIAHRESVENSDLVSFLVSYKWE